MARKRSKKGEKVRAGSRIPFNPPPIWPDLPKELLSLISAKLSLRATVQGSGVTKSWRTRNNNCSSASPPPNWLELSSHPLETKQKASDMYRSSSIPWTFRKTHRMARLEYLSSLDTSGDASLPVEFINSCHRDQPAYFIYGYGTRALDTCFVDPNCHDPSEAPSHLFRVANGIGFRGKFYVLSLQGTLALVEVAGSDPELTITRVRKRRAVPSVESKYFREFMVESDGKVLVVFLVSRQSIEVVDDVEIYEVDVGDLALVKKKSIDGGRSLFLGTNCAMSVLASQVTGCRRNCVYFTIYPDKGWWVYDTETNNISDGCM